MRPLITQHSTLNTQHFILGFLLVFCLFSSPCFAQSTVGAHLPSFPNLPSGERLYSTGGASPDLPGELDSVSHPIDTQGDLKTDTDGVKANKYKINYNGTTKKIQGKTENGKSTRQEDSKIENGKGTRREDLEASEFPDQTLPQPDVRSFGFEHRPPLLGRIGFDTGAGKSQYP
jgi:hypothetical protein